MPRVTGRLEAGRVGAPLDDAGDGPPREGRLPHSPVPRHLPEDVALGDPGRLEPRPRGLDRAGVLPVGDADLPSIAMVYRGEVWALAAGKPHPWPITRHAQKLV
jgi:hypothetical protein